MAELLIGHLILNRVGNQIQRMQRLYIRHDDSKNLSHRTRSIRRSICIQYIFTLSFHLNSQAQAHVSICWEDIYCEYVFRKLIAANRFDGSRSDARFWVDVQINWARNGNVSLQLVLQALCNRWPSLLSILSSFGCELLLHWLLTCCLFGFFGTVIWLHTIV